MKDKTLIIFAVAVAAGILGARNRYVFSAIQSTIMEPLADIAEWMKRRAVANLSRVTRDLLDNANVRAFLRVIREGESGQTDAAYRVIVGGQYFTGFADHPRIFGTATSTAAGAYQITRSTWDWIRPLMKLADFSPANQDFAAVGLIAYRGALADVIRGDLAAAIPKLRNEWTSLPGAAEVRFMTMDRARTVFINYGGTLAA